MTYRTIVVGTDGSATATRAVDQATTLAGADSARLVIVTAFESRGQDPTDPSVPEEVRWLLAQANTAEESARQGRERAYAAGLTDVVVQALEGPPAEELIAAATDFNADLIVVGSVGLTGNARFLGSIASSVLHHAPCDVLVVHTH